MKTKFGFSQFVQQNTPILFQKIGDISLICAAIGIFIMGIPSVMVEAGFTDFVMPLILIQIAKICAAIGISGKFLTKMIGKTTDTGVPVSTAEQVQIKQAGK